MPSLEVSALHGGYPLSLCAGTASRDKTFNGLIHASTADGAAFLCGKFGFIVVENKKSLFGVECKTGE